MGNWWNSGAPDSWDEELDQEQPCAQACPSWNVNLGWPLPGTDSVALSKVTTTPWPEIVPVPISFPKPTIAPKIKSDYVPGDLVTRHNWSSYWYHFRRINQVIGEIDKP